MEIEVKGNSGCSIDIVRDGERLMVRKATSDGAYAPRLAAQGRKQQLAAKHEWQHIRVPRIINLHTSHTSTVIDMDYVYSRNFIDFFEQAGFEQIDYFINAFTRWIDREVEASPITNIPSEVVTDKARAVAKKAKDNTTLPPDISPLLERCLHRLDMLPELLELPVGQCHGDLTFSNILFNGNNYYLIDFLDSFVETPLCDIVKLRQDTCHGWSRLMYTGSFDTTRLDIISRHIDRALHAHFSRYPWYTKYYRAFQLLNIMRILPYCREERVGQYLHTTIQSLLDSHE